MKQLHLTGKIACALLLTAAAVAGCKDKDPIQPPSPVVETPAANPPPAAAPAPAPDAPAPAPAPTTEPAPPAR